MKPAEKNLKSWRSATTLQHVISLCERGVLMRWGDAPRLVKLLSKEDQMSFISHSVEIFAKSIDDRYFCEITIENQLIWLSHGLLDQHMAAAFIKPLLAAKNYDQAIRSFVEISMTTEMTAYEYSETITSSAVSLICAFGKDLVGKAKQEPKNRVLQDLLAHITTYLLSVSNLNNYTIRLSLFNYFGYTTREGLNGEAFDKIMNRFGFTVLDYLLALLFTKKSEGIALKFLLDNFPYVLNAEPNCQKMVHQTLKYYMLKKPERFLLFLGILTDQFAHASPTVTETAQKTYLQHLGALLKVAAEINHKNISLELFYNISRVYHPYKEELITMIFAESEIKNELKEHIQKNRQNFETELALAEKEHTIAAHHQDPLHIHKRGRYPHISLSHDSSGTIEQISELSHQPLAKVS